MAESTPITHPEADRRSCSRGAISVREGELADRSVRLEAIKVEPDQCWDLLRQRDARALRPGSNGPGAPAVVERYKQ